MIYVDPTEIRSTSSLPGTDALVPLDGLEGLTGADALLTALDKPIPDLFSVPGELMLREHCRQGMLIQRKSGMDLLNSLPDLKRIIYKMREWSPQSWLVYTGTWFNDDGQVNVNGKATNWGFTSFVGSLVSWQRHGGQVIPYPLTSDNDYIRWIRHMELKLAEPHDILPLREIATVDDEMPWRRTLLTLPGIGEGLADEVANYAGDLWSALTLLTNYDTVKQKSKPKGIGKKTIQNIREYFNIPEDAYGMGLYINR